MLRSYAATGARASIVQPTGPATAPPQVWVERDMRRAPSRHGVDVVPRVGPGRPDHIVLALRAADHSAWQERGSSSVSARDFRFP
jgi:hypothetical protein